MQISNHRTRLLYPSDYFPVKDARLQAMYSTFIQNFAEFLKTNATPINLAKIWLQDDPSKTGMPIDEYLDTVRIFTASSVIANFSPRRH